MLLTIGVPGASRRGLESALRGEVSVLEEFWFGRGLAWLAENGERAELQCSLFVDMPKLVARTKRRDVDERSAVSFCDPYAYTGCGLMSVFLRCLGEAVAERASVDVELISYPNRPHADEIARRLFVPVGYEVSTLGGRLKLHASRLLSEVFAELPILLLALDRRTRLFVSKEELADIAGPDSRWVFRHPARRAIELALEGKRTGLRQLLAPGSDNFLPKSDERKETALDVLGTPYIETALAARIPIAARQRAHALGMFARMNVDPRWLVYLPAAVASVQSSSTPGELEHPEGALNYYASEQVEKVVVEQKHMGSRAIVVVCRDSRTALERFGVDTEIPGTVYTRNGRRFFDDSDTEAVFIERLGRVLSRANLWKRFSTNWFCFDGEILPWSLKASESSEDSDLVMAGNSALVETIAALNRAPDVVEKEYWLNIAQQKTSALSKYDQMFQRYRSESAGLSDMRFAPFHLLATENETFFHRSHLWHVQVLNHVARAGGGFVVPTRYEVVETGREECWSRAISWWEELSERGEEGLVVKPLPFIPRGRRGFAQPALKCRSREHLRLVYGPEYDSPEAWETLAVRDALKRRRQKHRRIRQQFALAIEAVSRFVQRNPMNAVHDCALGVLALEVAPTEHH